MIMNEKNKGIFYGIVAVATLIVAIVGATLAYFSVFASSNENAVGLTSKVVNISYTDGQNIILADELIPSEYRYVVESYERPIEGMRDRCIDDRGQQICAVYDFTVENVADTVDLAMNLRIGLNEFKNLKYMLYEVSGNNRTNIYASLDSMSGISELSYPIGELTAGDVVSIAGYDDQNEPVKYQIGANTTKTFELVIYLNEANEGGVNVAQDYEQGKSFAGTIEIKIGDGNDNVTGYVSRADE